MVGLHTVDAPPQARQPKCQAFWRVTPNKMPSKLAEDAKQNANQIGLASKMPVSNAGMGILLYHEPVELWFHGLGCRREKLIKWTRPDHDNGA
jgi:hypothetical protein